MSNGNYLKGLAEALIPYLMPYIENKIKDELMVLPTSETDDKLILTKKQVMERYQISAMTLWRLEQSGKLTPVRIGRKVMYRPVDVEKIFK